MKEIRMILADLQVSILFMLSITKRTSQIAPGKTYKNGRYPSMISLPL